MTADADAIFGALEPVIEGIAATFGRSCEVLLHDYRDPDSPVDMNEPERFVHDYRKAGGTIELVDIDYAKRDTDVPSEALAKFFAKHLG